MLHYLFMDLLVNILVATVIVIALVILHECCHYITAVKLGCKIVDANFLRGKVVVDVKDPKQSKKIKNAPYYIVPPLCIVLLIAGFKLYPRLGSVGLLIASTVMLVAHTISFYFEGVKV